MPRPVRSDQKYLPGLDGLRALAVTAVIAYHLGYGWAQGGLLGVGVFFTLSGYLITDILVGQFAASGRIKLGDFWMRRARRLLPALFVMLAVVTVWVNGFNRAFVPGYRGDVVASGLYVNNWWYIFQHDSYYSRFAPPAPLDHLWSLAVEEQFYLVWPWVVLAMVLLAGWMMKRRRVRLLGPGAHVRGSADGGAAASAASAGTAGGSDFLSGRARWAMAGVALVLAAASGIEMALLFHPGYDPTRVYEGTDTRAFGLLIGAAVAMVYPTRRGARPLSAGPRRLPDAAGRARRDAGRAARPGARLDPDALDRRPLLRHLPLALPDHRADCGGRHRRHAGERGPGGGAGRRDRRHRRRELAVHRGPDPPRQLPADGPGRRSGRGRPRRPRGPPRAR